MANYITRRNTFRLFNQILLNKHKTYQSSCRTCDKYFQKRNFHKSLCLQKIVSFNLSDIGEGIREVTVKEWYVKENDVVQQFDNLCEVQSDKASVTITSRYDGKITKIHHQIDDVALVGHPLLDFDIVDDDEKDGSSSSSESSSSGSSRSGSEDESVVPQDTSNMGKTKVLTTPAVRRIAMENNLDLSKVTPTGNKGRLLKGDVLEHLNLIPKGTVKPHPTLVNKVEEKKVIINKEDRVVKLRGVAKAMFNSMRETLKIPHFSYKEEIDMTRLVALRQELKDEALAKGVKLTFMPFFLKSASLALNEYPILNSSVDDKNESVIYKASHNISVAIDTPQGLVVPNIKNCEKKSILQIAKDLSVLIERAQKGQLRIEDYADGTFALSNIGVLGGTYTHPCIVPPQVAIGGIGKIKLTPRFDDNGDLIKAHIMYISWCADHRIIDGVTIAKFSNLWKKYLENPNLLIIQN